MHEQQNGFTLLEVIIVIVGVSIVVAIIFLLGYSG